MSLLITLIKAPDSIAASVSSMVFDGHGGTMGRGEENNWVLEDPELYLSSLHCEISYENGQYFMIDRSTNGTFYNGSVDPMGKGSRLPINNNDRFIIGDYEFSLTLQHQAAGPDFADGPFSEDAALSSDLGGSFDNFDNSPFESPMPSFNDSLFASTPSESDPLAALDKARGGSSFTSDDKFTGIDNGSFPSSVQSDSFDPLNQPMDWPKVKKDPVNQAANVIPDDWDLELDSEPVPQVAEVEPKMAGPSARERALEIANQKLLAEVGALKQLLETSRSTTAGSPVDSGFIEALGLQQRNMSDAEIDRISRSSGKVMRAMIEGLMQVLSSRSSIKNEFRMNVTTIQPVENNPLKFSANVDDALENMFMKSGNAFKAPLEAVREGFEGVAEHQVAILAGIREAFKGVIERFDPILLEERFARQSRGGILPGSQKAKNWEAYTGYYEEVVGDIDKSFQYLFGDGFVRAYEDQLQKLAISRKSRKQGQNNPESNQGQT